MNKILKSKFTVFLILVLALICIMGIFAPFFSLHDPLEQNIINKYADFSREYPLGTDSLGRCIYSRVIYGIRSTLFLSAITMFFTILIGTIIGLISGYFKGTIDEIIMRICDIVLSFPSQVMILAIVGILGVGIKNIVIANIVIKWAWYARMIRSTVIKYNNVNYILFSKAIKKSNFHIIYRHILPRIFSEIIVLGTLDMGWVIINISTLSFLGLGIQPPNPEWGAMLNEAKNSLFNYPQQMIGPGVSILSVVAIFNMLGDSLRDVLDPKESV